MTSEEVRRVFDYRNGALYWRAPLQSKYIGKPVGSSGSKYSNVQHNGSMYKRGRLVWQYFNGDIPKGMQIDHINGNKFDDRIENLRLCTTSENCCNQTKRATNTSGYKNVSFHKATGKFVAQLQSKGIKYHLGLYETPELAYAEVLKASKELHKEFSFTNRAIPSKQEEYEELVRFLDTWKE